MRLCRICLRRGMLARFHARSPCRDPVGVFRPRTPLRCRFGVSARPTRFADLRTRLATGLALGGLTLGCVWAGGLWTAGLFALAAAAMAWEIRRMAGARDRLVGALVLFAVAAAVLVTGLTLLRWGMALLAVAALFAWLVERRGAALAAGQMLPGLAMACIVALRADPAYGFEAVLWLFLVVIASDVGGYFGGRLIGGPKLWPRLSPKKTWAGSLAGMALAAILGALFSRWTTGTLVEAVAPVSALAALVAQGGDLAESALKRRLGVKDASQLLPGHGGVLDRLDGLMAAALLSAAITFSRGASVFIW
ncbi:MAG: phosphatidate cytidylyltransferase [Alphaproteobacteria bacterium]|nr:MAG: phosphatidate cytidylyltransferase [Alphaproteobacteria bacterium]